jgi:hypothetical protein
MGVEGGEVIEEVEEIEDEEESRFFDLEETSV